MPQKLLCPGSHGVITVMYHVFAKNLVVFCAIDHARHGSSINNAEAIAQTIAQAEGRCIEDLRFFDLQTKDGYSRYREYQDMPEDLVCETYQFDEVLVVRNRFTNRYEAVAWQPTVCPREVHTLFWHQIGRTKKQAQNPRLQRVTF